MGISHWAELLKRGISNPDKIPIYIYDKLTWRLRRYRHLQKATNIYKKDWDLLVILDCARPDMMEEVKKDYEFIGEVEEITSVGSCSMEWMKNTFIPKFNKQMQSTIHITSNTSSDTYLSDNQFQHLEEVWRDGWNKELGTIPAEEVTDRAIYYMRRIDADRAIVHYMQPHLPFVTRPDIDSSFVTKEGEEGKGHNLSGLCRERGYGQNELWNAYIENLKYVLDSVEILLSNVNAEQTIISADHGEAFGEKNIYGHPCRNYVDSLTQVPWCPTSAVNCKNYNPEYEPKTSYEDDVSLDNKLKALGYK
jgi:hypothetical protein